jgi:acetoin utilization deacetylase AcuC-like enzyme
LPIPSTAYVGHGDCPRHDTGWSHPDHQGRLPAIARALYRDTPALMADVVQIEAAAAATEEELRRVHTARHVEAVRRRSAEAGAAGRTLEVDGVPVSAASWLAATAAAGTALTAVDTVLAGGARNAFAAARPPGAGARPDAAGGFALFNNVAIAARHLRERHGLGRVLTVSWAAAHPAALAEILGRDHETPLVSLHADPRAFPDPRPHADASFDGGGALRPGAIGGDVAQALAAALDGVARAPDFVLLAAGFDVLAGDPVGGLGVSPDEVHPLTRVLVEWTEARCGGRLVSVLEGGYDAAATARAVVQHVRALAGLPPA